MAGLALYEMAGLGVKGADKIFKRGWYDMSFGRWPQPGRWIFNQASRPFRASWQGLKRVGG